MCSVVVLDSDADDGLPTAELERRICELAADIAAATYRWLLLIAEFDRRGAWADQGSKSCAYWLSWRCGVGLRAARDYVRVAHCLEALPLVRDAFSRGELTYSKVRALTRVAQPENEAALMELAVHATGAQLDRIVRGYAGVIRATEAQALQAAALQQLNCCWDDQGMLNVNGRLTPEVGARLLAALDMLDDHEGTLPERRAVALGRLADEQQNCELVVHVDAETLPAAQTGERAELEGGPALAPETVRRLGCDGSVTRIIERDGKPLTVGRRRRTISPALRKALASRDKGCRFPGCDHTRYLHAHHIQHWARGGRTDIENLIQLCTHHHRLVHEGGYKVTQGPSGAIVFRTPKGQVLAPDGQVTAATGPPLHQQNTLAGIDVDAGTCRPLSAGDRCDYGLAVEGLAQRWLPPPGGP